MDSNKISSFAQLLRENGDKILNSGFKLVLSGSLLRALNDSFVLIVDQNEIIPPKNFQMVKVNHSKSQEIHDLQFIHDFIQKTNVLCITIYEHEEDFNEIADISKFRSLQKLEIQRFNVKQIHGIQQLRSQLQEIICVRRSLDTIKDIISECGGDKSNGFVWNELKCANFACNNLTTIDCSLEFAPLLQTLNLSHNQIVSVDAIKWLPKLQILDLSYNKLTRIPHFNVESGRRLQELVISNNYIEDLYGVARLDALRLLDVSGNCLLDHTVLSSVSNLSSLSCLNLNENPLAFNPTHRYTTARYLHRDVASNKFVLDNEPLTKYEKSLIGLEKSHLSIFSSRTSLTQGDVTPNRSLSYRGTPTGSVSSLNSGVFNENSNSKSNRHSGSQRKIKVRKVTLEEDDNDKIVPEEKQKLKPKSLQTELMEANNDHLETKKEIENLREKYGSHWLQRDSENGDANSVPYQIPERNISSEILRNSLKSSYGNSPSLNSSLANSPALASSQNDKLNIITSTPIQTEFKPVTRDDSNIATVIASSSPTNVASTDFKSVNQSGTFYQSTIDSANQSIDDIVKNATQEEVISDPEDNEDNYDVEQENGEKFFLVVSDVSIREKDANTGHTRHKWTRQMLESCERIKSDVIQINFSTLRKDRKKRVYKMDKMQCQKLETYLRDILSQRPLSEMKQALYQCASCSVYFSREITQPNMDIRCHECGSTFVIQMKESPKRNGPLPSAQPEPAAFTSTVASSISSFLTPKSASAMFLEKLIKSESSQQDVGSTSGSTSGVMKKSSSQTSLAPPMDAWRPPLNLALRSVGSFNESSSCSKISNSDTSFDSNQSVAGSSNSERDRDRDIMRSGMDSDIEILSNPSQSSIEVLDRKPSEERRISRVSLMESIEDDENLNVEFSQLSTTLTDQGTSTQDDLDHYHRQDKQSSEEQEQHHIKEKSGHLLAIGPHLTESSSSGSVTDSICTAYEQNDGSGKSEQTINGKSNQQSSSSVADVSVKSETSVLSSMLNNLLQSTNILLSKSQRPSSDSLKAQPFESFKYSYTNYTDVDHRIKLYLYQHLFEDDNEHFKWLAKGKILDESMIGELPNGFNGIFVMSTNKFYVLKYTNSSEFDDDPTKWLKKVTSVTAVRLESATVLPWKIGISFAIRQIGTLHLLLYDILRTDSFLLHLSSNLPETCAINYQPLASQHQKLLKVLDNQKIEMFCLLRSCTIAADAEDTIEDCSCAVTDTHLYLGLNSKWICTKSDFNIEIYQIQEMANLIEYKRLSNVSFRFYFLDEKDDRCENWEVVFETETCADSTLNAICQAWEKIFEVPLTTN